MRRRTILLSALLLVMLAVFGSQAALAAGNSTDTQTGFDFQVLVRDIASNPQLLAAIMAIIWNIGGYCAKMLGLKQLEKWEPTQFLETLVLFETLFTVLGTLGGLPATWATALTLVLAFTRSLKKAIQSFITTATKT